MTREGKDCDYEEMTNEESGVDCGKRTNEECRDELWKDFECVENNDVLNYFRILVPKLLKEWT